MGVKGDLLLRLFEAYGKNPNQAKMYYYEKWANSLPAEKVESIIDAVVMDESFLPTPNKLYAMTRSRAGVDRAGPQEDCWFCDGTGMVPGIFKDQEGAWWHCVVSACKCSNGHSSRNMPLLNFELDTRYLDLLKVMRKHKDTAITPWGAAPYFYQELRAKSTERTKNV